MNIYITYDRYEHDEWFSVFHIETNKARAIKHFREIDLIDFICYGPDDCHSFQLQKVVLSKKEYEITYKASSHIGHLDDKQISCNSCIKQHKRRFLYKKDLFNYIKITKK